MKHILRPAVQEISERYCDVCGKPGASILKFNFGYNSVRDLDYLEVDFCNECGEEMLKKVLIETKNKVELKCLAV